MRPPPPAPRRDALAIAQALLAHGDALAGQLKNGPAQFTPNPAADALIRADPFAFLLAVIADMGIPAERAWALPYELRSRLGSLSPYDLAADPQAVRAAVQESPKLHRFVNMMPDWLVQAARIVVDQFGGDAARLWSDEPTATELRRRLEGFPGIGQKKAAMAVEILARDLGQPLRELSGGDVAYDVHLRRVFMRTGLADRDSVEHMVAVARTLNPDRPGALDLPGLGHRATMVQGATSTLNCSRIARSRLEPGPADSLTASSWPVGTMPASHRARDTLKAVPCSG